MNIWLQSKMNEFGIAVLTLLIGVNATPQCTYQIDVPMNTLKCVSGGNDYVLEKGLVSNQDKVKRIVLEHCDIIEIKCDAFTNLSALADLSVRNNKISELPSDTFAQLNNLRILNLEGNRLKTLQPDVFDSLIKLESLSLSNNAVDGKNLSPRIFANNKIMNTLDLSGNNMSAAPEDLLQSFQRLEVLNLGRCILTKVPSFTTKNNLKTLVTLSLSNNQISSLDDPMTFIHLENIKKLYLNRNSIENIVSYVFTPLRQLKYIFLDHNHLKTLSDKLFQDLPILVLINLSYNEIEVINLDSFRNTPMEHLNLEGNRLSYMPANFYDILIISGGNLNTFYFNNNPWQCACLREILQEVKTHNVKYGSAAYDGNRPVCLNTDDDFRTCKRGEYVNCIK